MQIENKSLEVQKKSKKRVFLVLAFLIIYLLYCYITYRGNYLAMLEIGDQYTDIFKKDVYYKVICNLINFTILFFSIYITTNIVKRGLKKFFEEEKKSMPKLPSKSIAFIVAIVVTMFISDFLTQKVMLAFNSAWFGEKDPIFNLDIGYFMFQKPFIEFVLIYAIVLFVSLTVYIAAYYIIIFNKYFDEGINPETLKKNTFIKQLMINIRLIAIAVSGLVLIKTQDIIYGSILNLANEPKTTLLGAGLSDATIKLWGYRILAVLITVCIFFAIRFLKKSQTKKMVIALMTIPVYLIILFVIIIGFDLLYVNQSKLDKEKNYISYNLESTKKAYGIDIEEIEISNRGTITTDDLENYAKVLSNINLVSEDVTLENLQMHQTSLGYYNYNNTKVGLYNIEGKSSLVYVTPREIVSNATGRTYNKKTYEYTHGYGTIITSAVTTSELGNVKYIQKEFDLSDEEIKITQPRIYFGMSTDDTVVTNSKDTLEYDYPITNTTNSENTYDGQAGLSLNFWDRLILGISNKDLKLAFSTNVTSDSKILINRNIIERAKTIMPYLMYNSEPYMVITDEGKLVWVIDAYTTSNSYPYSQETIIEVDGFKRKINYIRNSVKVLIDAYDGTVEFYLTDKTDPIAMAYNNMYPTLFVHEEIPEDIAEHLVYSEYLYNIQAEMITLYHNVQTEVLYRADDVWAIANQNTSDMHTKSSIPMKPYYTVVKTVDEEKSKLGLVLPYTQSGKQNITSYLIGTYDKDNKAKLTIYKYKDGSNVLGPTQLDTQIEEDEKLSKEIESINVTGTQITRNMIIVPIDDTLLYIEPIYQVMLNETQEPRLKKVVVASGTKLAIGNDLEEALTNLLSQYAINIEIENTDTVDDLVKAIIKANNNLKESSNNNDWELIGKDLERLQTLINELEVKVKEEESKTIKTDKE